MFVVALPLFAGDPGDAFLFCSSQEGDPTFLLSARKAFLLYATLEGERLWQTASKERKPIMLTLTTQLFPSRDDSSLSPKRVFWEKLLLVGSKLVVEVSSAPSGDGGVVSSRQIGIEFPTRCAALMSRRGYLPPHTLFCTLLPDQSPGRRAWEGVQV